MPSGHKLSGLQIINLLNSTAEISALGQEGVGSPIQVKDPFPGAKHPPSQLLLISYLLLIVNLSNLSSNNV